MQPAYNASSYGCCRIGCCHVTLHEPNNREAFGNKRSNIKESTAEQFRLKYLVNLELTMKEDRVNHNLDVSDVEA
ncbi:hypothetical protein TSUD_171840 [Trifolium subterraneum]|uniref:Uncharacterized protein n=1 Tax=Trifolium subterraneum TaxID=3900 RepID=A0A2Z6LKN5_TRISU|nr:hypothetical protein TSUD_171840 [Trifolium subterraneum]